jgi:hypothetical protein
MNTTSLQLFFLTLLLGISGCYKASFYQGSTVAGTQHDEWESFFLYGLVGSSTVDVREFCPEGQISSVRSGGNFGTELVSVLTFGLYTPREVSVRCADRPGAARQHTLSMNSKSGSEPTK